MGGQGYVLFIPYKREDKKETKAKKGKVQVSEGEKEQEKVSPHTRKR